MLVNGGLFFLVSCCLSIFILFYFIVFNLIKSGKLHDGYYSTLILFDNVQYDFIHKSGASLKALLPNILGYLFTIIIVRILFELICRFLPTIYVVSK